MSQFHAKSLRLGIRQEWATTQYLFHPKKNSTVSNDENAKSAIKHFFNSKNALIAFGPGSIKHSPSRVAIQLYSYSPSSTRTRSRREGTPSDLDLTYFFPLSKDSSDKAKRYSFSAVPSGKSLDPPPKVPPNDDEKITSTILAPPQNSEHDSVVQILADLYRKPVVMTIINLKYPYLNSYILAQFIAINSVRYGVSRIVRSLFKKVPVTTINTENPLLYSSETSGSTSITQKGTGTSGPPSPLQWNKLIRAGNRFLPVHITGIKVEVAGRMGGKKGASRTGLLSKSYGSFRFKSMDQSMIDYAKVEGKNKNGSFTVKVWIGSTCITPRKLNPASN